MCAQLDKALQQVGGDVDDAVEFLVAEEESLDQIVSHDESYHSENNLSGFSLSPQHAIRVVIGNRESLQLFMDGYSGKRGTGGLMPTRKGYNHNVTFKDTANDRLDNDQNHKLCNRIGCSGKIKYNQNTNIGSSDKAKCTNPTFYPSDGNETIGSSSSSSSVMTRTKRSFLDSKRSVPPQLEFDSSESTPEFLSSPSGSSTVTEIGSSSKIRPREKIRHKFGPNNRNTCPTSSVPSVSQSSSSNNQSRFGLRNMKCNSIPDVVVSYSSSESKSAEKNAMKKRSTEGESSRGRKTPLDGPFYPSTSGISISGEDTSGAASVRTRRSMNVNNSTTRLSYRQNERNSLSFQEPETELTINIGGSSNSSSGSSSYSISSSNGDSRTTNMPFILSELGFTRFMNRDAFQRYNMDGITEVLLALERIEQDEELTHEQVRALETGLFLSGLNLYDQHRDMRLDIDNMSYEELLALEERMGTVSTALSEESLLKCLRKSIYQETPSEVRVKGSGEDGDDNKCSICQEEYILGDEIGKLVECHHGFHSTCINQWLRVKNWCPICKASAESPSS
ncbi:hypothetical protein BUALT_Bualt05G0028500 [Buddleja alternifolia]|uniref:RING-type E3 ubiquitin transferase n=1 Tax=Buddleja alternifolia TaxID=168488 RepID=A0AAV6XN29_9LAMI|nr:hypothetical protein BUALT_Bualt05G0028500 [Buddleja alternifolia]